MGLMVSVGGATASLAEMSRTIGTKENRALFIKYAIDFLRKNQLDGIDLDFEYPGKGPDSGPEDKERFTDLVMVPV